MACWLLDPDSKEPTLHGIVTSFLPHELPLLEGVETGQGIQSLGLNVSTELSGRYRASVESILIFNSMNQLNSLLKKENLQGKNKVPGIFMLLQTSDNYIFSHSLSQVDKFFYTFNANHIFGLSDTGVNKLFCQSPDSKYFWFYSPDGFNCKYPTLPSYYKSNHR